MQAQKAFDSPRRANRGAVADLKDRLNLGWPKARTALPPRLEIIFMPLNATYKARAFFYHSFLLNLHFWALRKNL
jgi:hypothetical protein